MLTIRLATPADAPIITRHRRAMFDDMRVGTPADLDAMDAQFSKWIANALAKNIYHGWFVEDEQGSIIAGAGLSIEDFPATPRDQTGRRAYVMNVYVEPDYRRQGLARRLMQRSSSGVARTKSGRLRCRQVTPDDRCTNRSVSRRRTK